MKSYLFEGVEYVESGERRCPQKGEMLLEDSSDIARRADHNFQDTRRILIPKEGIMKYKQTDKNLSRMSVWEAMTDTEKECAQALTAFSNFDARFSVGFGWQEKICYHTDMVANRLFDYLKANPHLYPWLVRHGFFEEVKHEWKPVALMLETEKEFNAIWHRLNVDDNGFASHFRQDDQSLPFESNCASLWIKIQQLRKDIP